MVRHHPNSGRHPYSLDWDMEPIRCENSSCLLNKRGNCVMPSVVHIKADGKCGGYIDDVNSNINS